MGVLKDGYDVLTYFGRLNQRLANIEEGLKELKDDMKDGFRDAAATISKLNDKHNDLEKKFSKFEGVTDAVTAFAAAQKTLPPGDKGD